VYIHALVHTYVYVCTSTIRYDMLSKSDIIVKINEVIAYFIIL